MPSIGFAISRHQDNPTRSKSQVLIYSIQDNILVVFPYQGESLDLRESSQ